MKVIQNLSIDATKRAPSSQETQKMVIGGHAIEEPQRLKKHKERVWVVRENQEEDTSS